MKILFFVLLFLLAGCTRNVEYIKAHATQKWNELGYDVIGYEGFKYSFAGGDVWYTLKRKDNPRVIYSGFLESYYHELQVYGPIIQSGSQLNVTQDE